jgi:pyridoxal phosphate enzyme (YggS family)
MDRRISENIKGIYRAISHAAMRAGREPQDIRLIAVTKNVGASAIIRALEIGLRDFGESRVQEFRWKYEEMNERLGSAAGGQKGYEIRWHLIGHLQKNKAKVAVEFFDLIHSVDSVQLADLLNRSAEKISKTQKIMIQVKLSNENSKYGIAKHNTLEIIRCIEGMKNLKIEGLMAIPPYFDDPQEVRPYFRELREIRDDAEAKGFRLPELSMGMSHDFEIAVEEGSTMVRVGAAIFGERRKGES